MDVRREARSERVRTLATTPGATIEVIDTSTLHITADDGVAFAMARRRVQVACEHLDCGCIWTSALDYTAVVQFV